MSRVPYPLPIDPEPLRTSAHLGLGTAHVMSPSCADGSMQVRALRPAVMTDGSDPLGQPADQYHGAFCVASIWQRLAGVDGDEQRMAVPLFAGTRNMAYAADSAAFLRLSERLAAPESQWDGAQRADLYAVPGTFVLWGIERLTAHGEPSSPCGYLAGVYVSDEGPIVLAPETMQSLLLHLSPAAMSASSRALFYKTMQALSERPVQTERAAESSEITEALDIFRSLHPRPVSRVQAAPADSESALAMPSYLALVTG